MKGTDSPAQPCGAVENPQPGPGGLRRAVTRYYSVLHVALRLKRPAVHGVTAHITYVECHAAAEDCPVSEQLR